MSAALAALLSVWTSTSADEAIAPGDAIAPHEVIVIQGQRVRAEPAKVRVRAREARKIPGTQGDALKVVQNLPGVGRAQLGSGALVVWGSAPRDTRVLLDGLSIPALYHFGGVRSTINTELVQAIELSPGAFGADYGRGLGGLVRVTTAPLRTDGPHGYFGADFLDTSAMLTAPLTPNIRAGVAGRFGWLDRVLAIFQEDIGELFVIPRYGDYQAKATFDLRANESLSILFLGSHDRMDRAAPSVDPREVRSETRALDWHRLSLHYFRTFEDGSTVSIAPGLGLDRSSVESAFGAVPATFSERDLRYSLRASHRTPLSSAVQLILGLDAEGTRARVTRSGSLNIPAREGDRSVFGRPPGSDIAYDDYRVELAGIAPFVSLELEAGPLSIVPGVRLEASVIDGEQSLPPFGASPPFGFFESTVVLEPRLALDLRLGEALILHAASGLYHQAPEPSELSAVFGSPALERSRALHASFGGTIRFEEAISLEANTFYKSFDRLVTRAPSASPMLARALTQDGTGRSFGAQLLLRKNFGAGLSGWVSYAISRSERRDGPDGELRLFDFDQTHVLSAVASYELDAWTFGARVRFASGFPRTPIARSYLDLLNDRYDPIFGAHNSTRIPPFFQADLRVERSFELSGMELSIYLDLENFTFRRNVEELAYEYDYLSEEPITGLPFLGVIGAKVEL